MTQEKNIVITAEEQEEISQNLPKLLQAIEENSPIAGAWLASWRGKRGVADEAQAQAEEIRHKVATAPPEQASIAQWCGFPTDMTRCSPFFPMNPKELGQRDFLRDFLITSANWGEIRYTGPRLSTYEEDVLLAVLAVLDGQSQERQVVYSKEENQKPRKTYTYKGGVLPLLRLLGMVRRPSKKDYQRLIGALKLLVANVVELSISTGKTKSGKRREPRRIHMSNILTCADWNDKEKVLTVTINPFFYETYMAGHVTLMDVAKRASLKGVIAKALYRFIQSQRNDFEGHFLTLADALNMDREQPQRKTREHLKKAINELIRHGVLLKKSGFVKTDILKLILAPRAIQKNSTQHVEK